MYTRYKYGRNADVVQISARGLTEFFRNSQKFRSNCVIPSIQQTLPSEIMTVDAAVPLVNSPPTCFALFAAFFQRKPPN